MGIIFGQEIYFKKKELLQLLDMIRGVRKNTSYHWRIKDEIYNDLVKKADKMAGEIADISITSNILQYYKVNG